MTRAEIKNIQDFESQGSHYTRVGVDVFSRVDVDNVSVWKFSGLRLSLDNVGFVEIENPLFFNERDVYRVRAFDSQYLMLENQSSRHMLLSGQTVEARFHTPCNKSFSEKVIIEAVKGHGSDWHKGLLLARFEDASIESLQKLTRHALLTEPQLEIKTVKELNLPILLLDFAIKAEQVKLQDGPNPTLKKCKLLPARREAPGNARQIHFYRYNDSIASIRLNFVSDGRTGSLFFG